MRATGILEAIGNTPLVELRCISPKPAVRIFAKLEGVNPTGSLKDRIARYMVEAGERSGALTKDKIILEPTSGNTGIALAMVARLKGYKVKVVVPDNVTVERRQLMELFGAEILYSDGSQGTNGSIKMAQQLAEDPRYFMPYQYGNPANPLAHYETTAAEILRDCPEVDVLVAGLGTGGTLMGCARRLKEHNPRIRVVAVEPHPGDLVQGLRSLDDGFIPPILDPSLLDSKIIVDSRCAFAATKDLTTKEGIFAGVSSGAVIHCAVRVAHRMERGTIVCVLCDGGWKYISLGVWFKDFPPVGENIQSHVWW
jgi:cysteine synthase B